MGKSTVKEKVDPKTGEIIKRAEIPEFFQKEIDDLLAENNQHLNNFMVLSQQLAVQQQNWFEMKKKIDESAGKVRDKMSFACKKIGLDDADPWTYHLQDKCFEMRTPPEVRPLTGSEIAGISESVEDILKKEDEKNG